MDTLVENIVKEYCKYCKRYEYHRVEDDKGVNEEGTGGSLVCLCCGSQRMWKIQGFDADLM